MRRAKIVATLGPAASSYEQIRAIIDAGVDVCRMNLSHGTYAVHEGVYANVRKAANDSGRAIAVMVDLQGPKIRLGKFEGGPYDLAVDDIFKITTEDILGNQQICGTTFKGLPQDVNPGDFLLIDDGKVKVQVVETDGVVVTTKVIVAGPVSNNKGINLPGVAVNVPALSEKDEDDLRWGMKLGADLIALSFVRDAADIKRVHEIMDEEGRRVPVIAKIEKPQAVENLTQMLESMIHSPVPTRAETSDVANAVLDGADAVMLSGETSVGEYPVVTVQTMARIVDSTEVHGLERIQPLTVKPRTQGGAITLAASEVAQFVDAKYVCIFTESGDSVRRMARIRSQIPMIAFTPEPGIRRRLALTWGVQTYLVDRVTHTDAMFGQVDTILLGEGLAEIGDKVVVISGSPPGIVGSTNDIRVYRVGDAHNEVAPAYAKK